MSVPHRPGDLVVVRTEVGRERTFRVSGNGDLDEERAPLPTIPGLYTPEPDPEFAWTSRFLVLDTHGGWWWFDFTSREPQREKCPDPGVYSLTLVYAKPTRP